MERPSRQFQAGNGNNFIIISFAGKGNRRASACLRQKRIIHDKSVVDEPLRRG